MFQIGQISNIEHLKMQNIINILDFGGKFIPCMHNNIIDNFCSIINQFDTNIAKLNSKIIFEKQKITKNAKLTSLADLDINNKTYKINSCNMYDCILENLKQKRIIDNCVFSPTKECLDLRFDFYNKLTKNKFEIKPNLSNSQIHDIKWFLNNKPFSVIQADKNIGLAIISNEILDSLSKAHLDNNAIYKRFETNPLISATTELNLVLNSLINEKHLNIPLNKLMIKNAKLGKFRILAKLHKTKFGIRPIINNTNHITSQLSKLIDLILQPVLRNTSTYLKDSQHLLQKCNDLIIDSTNVFLYSMDFESLYTNIQKEYAVTMITEFINQYLNPKYITAFAFFKILSLIFDFNYFYYKNTKKLKTYFKQINGLSMGCICGPSIASLFVYILEIKWLKIHKPLFYGRFIDDINLISKEELNEQDFKSYFLNLKLNIIQSKIINFLDLEISFDNLTKKLNFSLYVKPTNTFCYLHTNSNHPRFIFKNIPKSLLIRIRRICTKYTDYLYFARKLVHQLLNRGYEFSHLFSLVFTIGTIDRDKLLPYKNKTDSVKPKKSFYFGSEFNRFVPNCNKLILESFDSCKAKYNLADYKLQLYNSMSNNIFSIFVHQSYTNRSFFKNTICCNSKNCITCKFINSNYYIKLKENFFIPLQNNCSCESSNLVYIIKCKLCNDYYVGHTEKSARIRLKQHIRAIVNFKPYTHYTNEVGHHFNLNGHNYIKDFSFSIFKDNLKNKKNRLSVETDIIHIIKNFNHSIINKIIPNHYNIKTLAFVK